MYFVAAERRACAAAPVNGLTFGHRGWDGRYPGSRSRDARRHPALRHWSSLTALAEFAIQRHGYGNTDGGFGITYPGDLDEYDRVVDGVHIPNGFVQVYGFWGPPDGYELLVPEAVYLITLAKVLSAAGHAAEAELVRALLEQQRRAER